MNSKKYSSTVGIRLSRQVLGVLKQCGIFAHSSISVEHQHLAKRYVVRGLESGGAAADIGHYVTFAGEDGSPAEYLHPVDSIGVNGPHAVVLAPSMVRIEMLRKAKTYELLITQHRLESPSKDKKPSFQTKLLFRGIHGRLELDLAGDDKDRAGAVLPTFYTMAGERIGIPKRFREAVRAATKAVNCAGCSHCHYTRSAKVTTVEKTTKALAMAESLSAVDAA